MSARGETALDWATDAWRIEASVWLDGCLDRAGRARAGPIEQPRIREWATVLTAPTSDGRVWLKAASPATAFEAPLYRTLRRYVPDRVLEPLGVDADRGWILLPDGGPTLRDNVSGAELLPALERILPVYAGMQLALAPAAPDLLADGVTDVRPMLIPERFEQALDITERSLVPSDRDRWLAVGSFRPTLLEWCIRLEQSEWSATLDHNDLHDGNILVPPDGARDAIRFYDWGDSVLAHPFASMLVLLRVVRSELRCADDDSRMLRVIDAYLGGFEVPGASRRELRETVRLACRVAKVARTLTWARAITRADGTFLPEFATAPLDTLASLLDDSYL